MCHPNMIVVSSDRQGYIKEITNVADEIILRRTSSAWTSSCEVLGAWVAVCLMSACSLACLILSISNCLCLASDSANCDGDLASNLLMIPSNRGEDVFRATASSKGSGSILSPLKDSDFVSPRGRVGLVGLVNPCASLSLDRLDSERGRALSLERLDSDLGRLGLMIDV